MVANFSFSFYFPHVYLIFGSLIFRFNKQEISSV